MKLLATLFLRRSIFFITACLVMVRIASAQITVSDSAAKTRQLIRIEQQLMDAIPMADSMLWKKYLSDDFFIVTEDGTRYSRKDFIATFRPLPKGYSGYIKVIEPHSVFHENTAVLSYVADEYESIFGQNLHTTYGVMNTYYRNDTSWKLISSQVYEIPQLPKPVKLNAATVQKYTGTYQLSDSNFCYITFKNDSLYFQKNKRKPQVLLPETETVFFTPADTRGRKIFVTNDKGQMLMLERRNGNDVVWKKIK